MKVYKAGGILPSNNINLKRSYVKNQCLFKLKPIKSYINTLTKSYTLKFIINTLTKSYTLKFIL